MATEKHDAWMATQIQACDRVMSAHRGDPESKEYRFARDTYDLLISASTHLCVATLNRLSDGAQTELKGCGKYEPLLDNLKLVRLMQ